jgi:septal ring factor EnvC (AmiA/AmiB activator)
MMYSEFVERYGKVIPRTLYGELEKLYMEAPENVTKDDFCANLKKHPWLMLQAAFKLIDNLTDQLIDARNQTHSQADEISDILQTETNLLAQIKDLETDNANLRRRISDLEFASEQIFKLKNLMSETIGELDTLIYS